MGLMIAGIPPMKPYVERYADSYVKLMNKVKTWTREEMIDYEKRARVWRDLQGKTEMDRFHIAVYQGLNAIMQILCRGCVDPWYSDWYHIQYDVQPERERVYIESSPSGARIWIDDTDTNRSTPDLVYVARDRDDTSAKAFLTGWHKITLVISGYMPLEADIYIGSGHGKDNPYRFRLSRELPIETTPTTPTTPVIPSIPSVPKTPLTTTPTEQQEAIFSPNLPVYTTRITKLPSFPSVPYAPATTQLPVTSHSAVNLPSFPSITPLTAPQQAQTVTTASFPRFPAFAGAKARVRNDTITYRGINEPSDSSPPLTNMRQVTGLSQYQSRLGQADPVIVHRIPVLPRQEIGRKTRQIFSRGWITDQKLRHFASYINQGLKPPISRSQYLDLMTEAIKKGYIHSAMENRHLWREKRQGLVYVAPYSQIKQPAVQETQRQADREVKISPNVKIIQKGRYYYREMEPGKYIKVKDIRGRTVDPVVTKPGSAYAARKLAQQKIQAKIQKQRAESYRTRAQQVRAALLKK